MPGKVNPVIPEVVNQIAFEVIGNDITVSFAAEGGQLQLNAFEPIIAHNLLNSLLYLRQGCLTLAGALRARHHRQLSACAMWWSIRLASSPRSIRTSATKTPPPSPEKRTKPAEACASVVLARGLLTAERLDEILRPELLTRPRPL